MSNTVFNSNKDGSKATVQTDWFVKRPVAVFSLSFFISVCILAALDVRISPIMYIAAGVLLLILTVLCIFVKNKAVSVIMKNVLISVLGITLASLFFMNSLYSNYYSFEKYYNTEISGEFTVTGVNYTSAFSNSYTAEGIFDGEKFKAVIETSEKSEIGDILRVNGTVLPFVNGVDFDEFSYYRSKGASVVIECDECEYVGRNRLSLAYRLNELREGIGSLIGRKISDESSSVIKAMLIGDKRNLSAETKEAFSRVGISHLLAISGMHVGMISAGAYFVLKRVKLGKKTISVIVPLLMLFYMGVTGFSPSVMRAVFLCCASSVVILSGISYDGVTSLGVCGSIMMLINPFIAYDMGMQLSFAAYLGCLAGANVLEKTGLAVRRKHLITRFLNGILSTAVFTSVVVIFTMPVSMLHFDSISVISPLSNLLFIPLFTVVIYLGIFVCIFSAVPGIGFWISHIADKYVEIILKLVRWVADTDNITVSLKYGFAPFLVITAAAFMIAAVCMKKKRYSFLCMILTVFTLAGYGFGIYSYNNSYRDTVRVLRSGYSQNDVIMISSEGELYAVDVNYGRSDVSSYILKGMSSFCETELDGYAVAHYGDGPLKTARSLKEKYQLDRVFLLEPVETETERYAELVEYLDKNSIEYTVITSENNNLKVGGSEVVFDKKQIISRSKMPIVSFKVNGNNDSFVYVSAAFTEAYDNIGKTVKFNAEDTLVVGAYGPVVKQSVKDIDIDLKNVYTFPKKAETNDNYYSDIPLENRMVSTDSKVFVLN